MQKKVTWVYLNFYSQAKLINMNNMTNLELLIKAIESKKTISFEYNKPGKTPGVRTGNPHILYVQQYKDTSKPKNSKLDFAKKLIMN